MTTRPLWASCFPESSGASLWLIGTLSAVAGLLIILVGVVGFRDYSLALFCGTPFVLGFTAPMLHGMGARRSFTQLLGAAMLAQAMLFVGVIFLGVDGIVCVLMAAPLWATVATVGALVAFAIHRRMWRHYAPSFGRGFPVLCLFLLAMVPAWMGAEHVDPPEAPILSVATSVDIDAPPLVVWHRVVSFPDLPAPGWDRGGWLFKVGIARPMSAEIQGEGLHATRFCVFSTGRAVEPVTAWEEGRLLEVAVTSTPPSMEETSIYPNLHPAHLEGYMESVRARFELIPLPGNRTRLIGTSWYRNRMFPVAYWKLWSDAAIKAVQVHVLDHVKVLSETDARLHPERSGIQ